MTTLTINYNNTFNENLDPNAIQTRQDKTLSEYIQNMYDVINRDLYNSRLPYIQVLCAPDAEVNKHFFIMGNNEDGIHIIILKKFYTTLLELEEPLSKKDIAENRETINLFSLGILLQTIKTFNTREHNQKLYKEVSKIDFFDTKAEIIV